MYDLFSYLTNEEYEGAPISAGALLAISQGERETIQRFTKKQNSSGAVREITEKFVSSGKGLKEFTRLGKSGLENYFFVRSPLSFGNSEGNVRGREGRVKLARSVASAICGTSADPQPASDVTKRKREDVENGVDEIIRNVLNHSQSPEESSQAQGWIAAVRTNYTMTLAIRDKGRGVLASWGPDFESQEKHGAHIPNELVALQTSLLPGKTSGSTEYNAGYGLNQALGYASSLCIASDGWLAYRRNHVTAFPDYVGNVIKRRAPAQDSQAKVKFEGTFVELIFNLK